MMPETGDIALFLLHTYLKGDVSPSERELSPEPVWLSGRGGVAVAGAVLTVPPVGWAAGCSLGCTYVPTLVSPRSLGSPSVSAVISLTKPCAQIPGARPCWSLPMLASC